MKKLVMCKFTMAAILVLACGVIPLWALGYMSQNGEDQGVANGAIAYAAQDSADDVEKTADSADDKKSTADKGKENKSAKDPTASDKGASSKTSKKEAANTAEDVKDNKNAKSKKADSKTAGVATMEGDFAFSEDADCAVCHTKEGESMTDPDMPASNHEALDCTTCHAGVDELAEVHDGVAYGDKTSKRLKKTEVDTASCETCHGSLEELAEITVDCEILSDTNGTVVNPHALPENEDHATVDCSSCHSMHKDKPLETTAKKACKGCHHMDVYECNTCHD